MSELVRDWKAEKKDLEEAFDIIADKLVKADAEVQRLKADVAIKESAVRDLCGVCMEKDKLITELCDALKDWEAAKHWGWTQELLQRAREATR